MNLFKNIDFSHNKEFDNYKISELFKFRGGKLSATKSSIPESMKWSLYLIKGLTIILQMKDQHCNMCHGGGTPAKYNLPKINVYFQHLCTISFLLMKIL